MTTPSVQSLFIDAVKESGFSTVVDEREGSKNFWAEKDGLKILVSVWPDDDNFLHLILPLGSVEPSAVSHALAMANNSTAATKVGKVYLNKERTFAFAGVEIFLASPRDFKAIFLRSVRALAVAAKAYIEGMKAVPAG